MTANPRRGEIWRVDLQPTRGEEMTKTRPALVVSPDSVGRLALRIVVPLTDWKDRYANYPWMIRIEPDTANGLSKTSAADAFQVRCISLERFVQRMGQVKTAIVADAADAVALAVGCGQDT